MKSLVTFLCLFCVSLSTNVFAKPPAIVPPPLLKEFTLDGKIPVTRFYFDNTYQMPKIYSTELMEAHIQKAIRRETFYYEETDRYIYAALDDLADQIRGKDVAVIGSSEPWYECILLSYGARPVVIEYNPISCPDDRVVYLTPAQFAAAPRTFDLILSISSTEHDGLGRYGDPIDPNGDLKSMANFKAMLNPGGKLLLSVPAGPDLLVWNAHRVYGPLRMKLLFSGWRALKYYGFQCEKILDGPGHSYQPVFLLTPRQ